MTRESGVIELDGKNSRELLLKHGIKNTRQRVVTLDILSRTETPQSAERIYQQIRDIDNTISLSTVYRFLEMMVEKGLVIKTANLETGRATFELNRQQHRHHVVCTRCQRIVVIEDCPLGHVVSAIERATSFSITGHRLEMYGLCSRCKDEEASPASCHGTSAQALRLKE